MASPFSYGYRILRRTDNDLESNGDGLSLDGERGTGERVPCTVTAWIAWGNGRDETVAAKNRAVSVSTPSSAIRELECRFDGERKRILRVCAQPLPSRGLR